MFTTFPRKALGAAFAAALLLSSVGAQATSLSFSGSTDSGPLVGSSFSGEFSYNEFREVEH